jgi:uncharacterized protein
MPTTRKRPAATRERSATIALDGGTGRIVVVSDTHSRPHPAMPARLAELRPSAILHGGDIGDLEVLEGLAAHAPVFAVRGNIDVHAPEIPDVMLIDVTGRPEGVLRILLTHIAVYGPKLRPEIGRSARSAGASLVVCGHSHVPFIGVDRDLTMFNPGSIGPKRFHLPIVFGLIEITRTGIRLGHFECETGAPWSPP